MTKTFAERCKMFEQCLPDATYRDLLRALHKEMLAKLAEQPAPEMAIADAYLAGVDSGIAAEREACAKVCDDMPAPARMSLDNEALYKLATLDCADAIRARGNT